MASTKGTRTEKNLLLAFVGESQARNKYTFFAGRAKKDGFEQIAAIFTETANQESEHAKRFFRFLDGGNVEVTASYAAGVIGSTAENLKVAAEGEEHEYATLYPMFAQIAREEGFEAIARTFEAVAVAERHHASRYQALLRDLTNGEVFKRQTAVMWVCRNCGYVHEDKEAPSACPACAHPQAYFEVMGEIA